MSQTFTPGTNNFARLSLLAGLLVPAIVVGFFIMKPFSPYPFQRTPYGVAIEQPVRFSHSLHSGQLNINCQYCHGVAEQSSYGGIPDTHTCMSCHSQIATGSDLLAPVRQSYDTGDPLVWNRVHDVADHVYFNHSVHIAKGFGCETCHGPVDQMPVVWQEEPMTMQWCLECHQAPEEFIRPTDEIYTFGWEPPEDQTAFGEALLVENNVNVEGLTSCSTCHR